MELGEGTGWFPGGMFCELTDSDDMLMQSSRSPVQGGGAVIKLYGLLVEQCHPSQVILYSCVFASH